MKKAFVIVGLGFLTACTGEQVTATLEAAVDAAMIAIPIVEMASGISPGAQVMIGGYLNAAQGCMSRAANIIGTAALTPAEQSAQVAGACAASATVALPLGTPQNVAAAVTAVADAIAKVIQTTRVTTVPVGASAFFDTKGAVQKHIDQKRLARIKKKLAKLRAARTAAAAAQKSK